MLIGVIFGCFARNGILARHQRFRRLNDALLHPLMLNGEHQQQRRPNDWDFEASDLSTSDDDDEDEDGSDNDTESDDNNNNNNNNNEEGDEENGENTVRPEDGREPLDGKNVTKRKRNAGRSRIDISLR